MTELLDPRVLREIKDHLVLQVRLARKAQLVQLVPKEARVLLELLGQRDRKGRLDLTESQAQQGLEVRLVLRGRKVIKDHQELLEPRVNREIRDPLESRARPVRLGLRDRQVLRVIRGPRVLLERPDLKVCKDPPELQVRRERLDLKGNKAHRVLPALRDHRGLPASLVLRVRLALKGSQVHRETKARLELRVQPAYRGLLASRGQLGRKGNRGLPE